ncbi:VOC family protein [Marilutibacter alkalisoli]|uniref:VOC family protein n=1 Tax=Marilutibacter alkalisoli TaxID=2591633 RepID=A0A514BRF3_9GAMM|nr:VOC family protein [Lysobacter alkalisoli]QDH69936.1 VOC family protein [Lysobacter alkalisoli]
MNLLLNIDVPDISAAEAFYTAAFGLNPGRRFGEGCVELLGATAAIYLLQKAEGSRGAAGSRRDYARHWTPLHCDVIVNDLDTALDKALAAGAVQEGDTREADWGRIVTLADPFGHGWCLLQFLGRGYDEIAT